MNPLDHVPSAAPAARPPTPTPTPTPASPSAPAPFAPGASAAAVLSAGDVVGGGGRRRWPGGLLIGLLLVGVLAWWWWGRSGAGADAAPRFQTSPVSRGALLVTVSATGNLQPTNQVDVGSELSGTAVAVLVDVNDRVKTGQVLARLDPAKLQDAVQRSQAALAQAEAQVLVAQATVQESRASLARLREVQRLSAGQVPAATELATAEASQARAEANEASARAAVLQAQATLRSDRTNLAKAEVRSPIDGVVLSRKLEPGQTVAASLQAPTLFTLAENLAQMELQVNVDEADVGQVRRGQPASFSVDAYADRRYPATISRVGLGSQTVNNVVSYLTLLLVDNADLSLRPGMTATADITTVQRQDALLVPNAALRWSPPAAAPGAAGATGSRGVFSALMPRRPGGDGAAKTATPVASRGGAQQVWVLDGQGQPQAVVVQTGASDGRVTEITGGGLRAGQAVVTNSSSAQP